MGLSDLTGWVMGVRVCVGAELTLTTALVVVGGRVRFRSFFLLLLLRFSIFASFDPIYDVYEVIGSGSTASKGTGAYLLHPATDGR